MCETIPSGAYVVRLPLDRTGELQDLLEGLGAKFNPRSSAIAFSESDHSERPVVMGHEARDLSRLQNSHSRWIPGSVTDCRSPIANRAFRCH